LLQEKPRFPLEFEVFSISSTAAQDPSTGKEGDAPANPRGCPRYGTAHAVGASKRPGFSCRPLLVALVWRLHTQDPRCQPWAWDSSELVHRSMRITPACRMLSGHLLVGGCRLFRRKKERLP